MPKYTAYGLTIHSEFEIPELAAARAVGSVADVRIRYAEVPAVPENGQRTQGIAFRLNDQEMVYSKTQCGRFLVRNGVDMEVDPDEGVDGRVLRLSLFGPAFGLLLIQRGFLLLHGGAVAFPEGTVLLLGPGGSGKSTLTAELCALGGKLLTDDVVAIDVGHSPPVVMPGVPILKLWPDAVQDAPEGIWTRTLHPDFDKLGRRMADSDLSSPWPVARAFQLRVGEQLIREPLAGAGAFQPLMGSLYAARYGQEFVAGLDGRDLLAKFNRLLQHAPLELLWRPVDRGLLRQTGEMVVGSLKEKANTGSRE